MENSKKFDPFSILIIVSVVIIVVLLGYMGILAFKNNLISLPKSSKPSSTKVSLNPDALYLSTPITNFPTAKITGKSSSSLTVEVNTQTLPDTKGKVLSFKVAITDATTFTKPVPMVPYALKSPSTNEPPLPPIDTQIPITLKDLNIGEIVSITLTDDLRFTSSSDIKALAISKVLESNSLSGPITEVSGNTFKVSSSVTPITPPAIGDMPPTPPENKTYTISLTSDTELNSFSPDGPVQMSSSDLKVGTIVDVFSADPITGTSFTAALVSIQPTAILPPEPPATPPTPDTPPVSPEP